MILVLSILALIAPVLLAPAIYVLALRLLRRAERRELPTQPSARAGAARRAAPPAAPARRVA